MSQYIYIPKEKKRPQYELARRGALDFIALYPNCDFEAIWRSFRVGSSMRPPVSYRVGYTTLRNAMMDLRKEGLIVASWKCSYPIFWLVYELTGVKNE